MAFGHAAVTVATTPTKIATVDTGVYIVNGDAQSIFIGGPDVAVSGARVGVTVAAAGVLQVYAKGNIYAVSVAGTSANAVKVLIS